MKPTTKELVQSEIADFCAGLGSPGEPVTPEHIQKELMSRIIPLLSREDELKQAAMDYAYRWCKAQDKLEKAEADLAALAAQNPVGMFMPGVEISPVKGRISYSQVFPDENGVVHESCIELFTRAAPAAVVVPWPNESAASAMFDIFYQASNVRSGNVQLSRSDAAELGKWLTEVLGLRDEANKKVGE